MAVPAAGQRITTAEQGQLVSNTLQQFSATQTTSTITMAAGVQDLTGATVTFTTTYANTKCKVIGVFDVEQSGTPADIFVGTCVVDGSSVSGEAHSAAVRDTCMQVWDFTLTAAGSHTIKLQGAKSGSANTVKTDATHTRLSVEVFGP